MSDDARTAAGGHPARGPANTLRFLLAVSLRFVLALSLAVALLLFWLVLLPSGPTFVGDWILSLREWGVLVVVLGVVAPLFGAAWLGLRLTAR